MTAAEKSVPKTEETGVLVGNTLVSAGTAAVGALTTMVDMVATGAPELDGVAVPVLESAGVAVPVAVWADAVTLSKVVIPKTQIIGRYFFIHSLLGATV